MRKLTFELRSPTKNVQLFLSNCFIKISIRTNKITGSCLIMDKLVLLCPKLKSIIKTAIKWHVVY